MKVIEHFRKRSRRMIAFALYYSGLLWLLVALKFHRQAFVLTYHRVLPPGADTFSADGIVVEPETFARQMAFLRRHFRVLSLDELSELFRSGRPLPSRSCIVTFDDGWFDNFEHALPVLRKEQIPAVVFVATGYIGGNDCFWQERLTRRLCLAVRHGGAPLEFANKCVGRSLEGMSATAQRLVVREAVNAWKDRRDDIHAIEQSLLEVLRAAQVPFDSLGDDRFMTWQEVTALTQGSRVTIGSHGCSHTPLTALGESQAEQELQRAREQIASIVGAPTTSIAYPNGNFNDKLLTAVRACGYQLGFTTEKGRVDIHSDPLALPRINMSESATRTMPEFLCAILLVFQRFRRPPVRANAHPGHR